LWFGYQIFTITTWLDSFSSRLDLKKLSIAMKQIKHHAHRLLTQVSLWVRT
jgi:hypothetical protein